MRERPILMSAPMVRSSLREIDPKVQTRRVVKSIAPPEATSAGVYFAPGKAYDGEWNWISGDPRDCDSWCSVGEPFRCPYGHPGDRLWVREAFSGPHYREGFPPALWHPNDEFWYWADGNPDKGDWTRPRPSIHMPRFASRITMEVTEVRVERLQDISEADAIAEGIEPDVQPGDAAPLWRNYATGNTTISPIYSYQTLWEQINGPGSWDLNPWVWVVGFRRLP